MGKGDIDDLATKFCVGSNAEANQTYRQVDYKDLRLKLQQERLKVHLDRQQLKKFNSVKTQYGTTCAFHQHKEVWLKEDISIKSQIRSISAVISEQADPRQLLCESEICKFINDIQEEFKSFEGATVQPIWEFIEDIQQWVNGGNHSNAEDIKPIFPTMISQQDRILSVLNEQSQSLEDHLNAFNTELKSWEFQAEEMTETLLKLRFPQQEVLFEYMEEYLVLDKKYGDAYLELRDYYSPALQKGKLGGWTHEDHTLYLHISQQYPVDKFQRSALCLEMLKLVLPHKTERDLREHSEWVQLYDLYNEHRKSIKRMHEGALRRLVSTAEHDCREQWVTYRKMQERADALLTQKEKTARLCEQLLRCREEKLQKIKAEEEELAEYQRKMNKERAELEKRRAKQRKVEKDKILVFREMKETKDKEYRKKIEEMQAKQEKLQKGKLAAGKKRVDYRQDLHNQKLEEQAAAEAARLEEEEKRKEQLDKLAATVAVEAPCDPLRVLQDTESTVSRMKDSEYIGRCQLFKVVGYEDSAIQGDMRLKVEKALRNAGLVNTDYGRHIMKTIKPPVEPRKDMISTVFKNQDNTT